MKKVQDILDDNKNAVAYNSWKPVSKLIWASIGLNKTIDVILKHRGYHPLDIMAMRGIREFPSKPKSGMDAVREDIALAVFGPQILTARNGKGAMLADTAHTIVSTLVSLSWGRHHRNANNHSRSLSIMKDSTEKAWKGVEPFQ